MRRRSVLSLIPFAFAGCVGSGVETPSRPLGPPNFLASFEWLPERSAYRVTFERGNVLTDENTERVIVEADPGKRTPWAGGDDAPTELPLRPGASIVVPAPEPGRVRVVWETRDYYRSSTYYSAVLDEWSSDMEDSS